MSTAIVAFWCKFTVVSNGKIFDLFPTKQIIKADMCVLVSYLKAYERDILGNTNTSGVNFHHIPLKNTHQQSNNNQQSNHHHHLQQSFNISSYSIIPSNNFHVYGLNKYKTIQIKLYWFFGILGQHVDTQKTVIDLTYLT